MKKTGSNTDWSVTRAFSLVWSKRATASVKDEELRSKILSSSSAEQTIGQLREPETSTLFLTLYIPHGVAGGNRPAELE